MSFWEAGTDHGHLVHAVDNTALTTERPIPLCLALCGVRVRVRLRAAFVPGVGGMARSWNDPDPYERKRCLRCSAIIAKAR